MLKKEFRLSQVASKGKTNTYNSTFFTIKVFESEKKKFAFVISKKVDKRAVARNALKRNLANVIAKNINNINDRFAYIIIAKPSILQKDKEEQAKILEEEFKKEKLLK